MKLLFCRGIQKSEFLEHPFTFSSGNATRRVSNWVGAWGLVPHASSHTTVQAVPHTAVPRFDTSEGVRLVVFGYQLPNVALAYPLIPSYFRQAASLRSN